MAIDPNAAPSQAPSWSTSAIENELPTYRAISVWAVAGLILGVVSAAAFASLPLVAASVGAIACGTLALRMIRRYPDQLTGSGLANLGIALGLITGLAAPTISVVQHSIVAKQAQAYGDQIARTLHDEGLAEAFWLSQPAPMRSQTTPQKLLAEVETPSEQEMMAGGNPKLNAFRSMAARLSSSDQQHVHVDGIESKGFDGTKPFAFVRLLFDGPETDAFPAEQFALVRLQAIDHEGQREWYVEDVTFPYESGSRSKVVESAHGHDH